jgi:lipopolysaccharide transport system ATP-binding protein
MMGNVDNIGLEVSGETAQRRHATETDAAPLGPRDPAVVAEGLSKAYLLWDNPRDRLKHPLRNMAARYLPIKPKTYYREFWALRDVGFTLHQGETLGIIGRNGSGKSTLLQVVCGVLTPTAGTFSTKGRVSALLELGSGFNPEFTGKDNVYMNASILGLSRQEVDERYDTIVDFADIGEFIDQPVKTYSSGMFVRLAFAIAAHVDAEILVVDEALAVGDAFFTQKCMRYMRGFREHGSLLFVSHDTGAVVNLCDRAILLEHGAVKAEGSARDVCEVYLEDMFAAQQPIDGAQHARLVQSVDRDHSYLDIVDQRLKYVNLSPLRNDIELFAFEEGAKAFGAGGARIADVRLVDPESDARLSWVVGGERVSLVVSVETQADLSQPIIGFMVKDRLGQTVFGDNTYLTYQKAPPAVPAGATFQARFTFRMPILPTGEYTIAASVAQGTQVDHVQLHWLHEALLFRSHTSSVCTGLTGVPMESVVMESRERQEAR